MTHFPALADALAAKRQNPNPSHLIDVTSYYFDNGQTQQQIAQRQKLAQKRAIDTLSSHYTPPALQIVKFLRHHKSLSFQPKDLQKALNLSQNRVSVPLKILLSANLIKQNKGHSYIRYSYTSGALKTLTNHIKNTHLQEQV